MFGRLFRREAPWQLEAEESRAWIDEALRNREQAELDVRRAQSVFHGAIADAETRLEQAVAEIEKAGERISRLESIVDRWETDGARRLKRIEAELTSPHARSVGIGL